MDTEAPPTLTSQVAPTPTRALVPLSRQPTLSPPSGLRYDPQGPDRDCGDFRTHKEAQEFFIAAGGPSRDPHRLDQDKDGVACETLP